MTGSGRAEDVCWRCEAPIIGAAPHNAEAVGHAPEAGDVHVCLYCGVVGIYTGVGLGNRRPATLEAAELAADPDVIRAGVRIHEWLRRNGH